MTVGSAPHDALRKILLTKQLLEDIEKMTLQIHTTYLEVFHSIKIRYLHKSIFFDLEKMVAGTQLASLDHNFNVAREQVANSLFIYCQNFKWLESPV